MKKIVISLFFLMLGSLCFAHEFIKVENVDEFGDSTGEVYYTLKEDKTGTYKDSDTTNGSLLWNMVIDKDGISRIVLKENKRSSDLSTSSRSWFHLDIGEVYTIKIKKANGSIDTFYGELVMGDTYKYDSLRFYINEQYYDGWWGYSDRKVYYDLEMKAILANVGNIGNGEIKISITSDYGSYSLGSLDVSGCEALFYDKTLYNEALAFVEKGEYENAIGKLKELESKDYETYSYYDCEDKIEEINNLIIEEKKKEKKIAIDKLYNEAVSLMKEEKYEQAIDGFNDVQSDIEKTFGEYLPDDMENLMENCQINLDNCQINLGKGRFLSGNFSIDDTVVFGEYEEKPIEWIVLDKTEDKALLLSKDILCQKEYNEECTEVTWENCTLRKWLNGDFYNKSFTDEEKSKIQLSHIANPDNTEYGTEGGNDTDDYVFLLSIDEAKKYFYSNAYRKAGVNWYLRSPGDIQYYAAYVDSDVSMGEGGSNVINECGIRPALWINL